MDDIFQVEAKCQVTPVVIRPFHDHDFIEHIAPDAMGEEFFGFPFRNSRLLIRSGTAIIASKGDVYSTVCFRMMHFPQGPILLA